MHIGLITRSQTDYVLDLANSFQARGEAVTLYLDHLETLEEIGDFEHPSRGYISSWACTQDMSDSIIATSTYARSAFPCILY